MSGGDGPLDFEPEAHRPRRPPPPAPPQRPPGPTSGGASGHRYAWFIGIAAILAVAALSIRATGPDAPRATGLPAGDPLPPFAVVRASSDIVCDDDDPCDANVARRAGQGEAGRRAACDVRGPTVLNVCALTERGPLVLGLAATRDGDCLGAFDRLAALARRHPGLQVAVVGIGGSLDDLRAAVRERGWRFAVGWDRDAILASVYGVAACPYITVARWRGRVQGTLVAARAASGGELERLAGAAVAASRRAGWSP